MKLRTGLKALIGISILGIGVAILLIYTCPFAGQIAFSTLVRQVPMEHHEGGGTHSQQHGKEMQEGEAKQHMGSGGEPHEEMKAHPEPAQKPHGEAEHEDMKEETHRETKSQAEKPREAMAGHDAEEKGFMVDLMVIPNVRSYPVKETKVFGIEVSPLGIIVLLVLIALCFLILRQRSLNLFRYTVTPKTMGVTVLLATLWNLVFAAFLLGVEVVQLKEL